MTETTSQVSKFTILLVEDSPVQQALTRRALEDSDLEADLYVVGDGVEALDYLHGRGEFDAPDSAPRPDIILLDLNMPRMDGHTTLEKIRENESLAQIPITVLTTSDADSDATASYARGANAFITKPAEYDEFVKLLNALGQFWAFHVKLPPTP